MRKRTGILVLLFILLMTQMVGAGAGSDPRLEQPYQLSNVRTYLVEKELTLGKGDLNSLVELMIEGPFYNAERRPYSQAYQGELNLVELSTIQDPHHNVMVVSDDAIKRPQRFKLKMKFKARTASITYELDPEQVLEGPYPHDVEPYLEPSELIESDHSLIRTTASQIVGAEMNPLKKAKKLFDYVYLNLDYNTNRGHLSALNALKTKVGVCEDYSRLLVALLRAEGIPARIVSGYRLPADEELEHVDLMQYRHMWVEFYLNGYGWIPADPTITFTGKKQVVDDNFAQLAGHYIVESSHLAPAYSFSYKTTVEREYDLHIHERATSIANHDEEMKQPVVKLQVDSTRGQLDSLSRRLDVAPYIKNGRTMVPLRFIAEAFGADVAWDGKRHEVQIQQGETRIRLALESKEADVNGQLLPLDAPAEMRNNRTLVPLRFISEQLNLQVGWEPQSKTITVQQNR